MRICMISGLEKNVGGGLENVVNEIGNFLTNQNSKVTTFFICDKDFVKISTNCINYGLRPYNILPPGMRFSHYETYAYSLKVWKKIRRLGPFDIIHGHGDYCFFPALFRNRTPLVMNVHGVKRAAYNRVYGPNSRILNSPRSSTLFLPEKVAAKKCDVLIACSKAERNDLIAFYGINPAKIKLIYNGVDINKFRPSDKKTARKILGLPENKNYAIWVGTNPGLKGLDIAMKAVRGLRNLNLLVVGISGTNFGNVIFWGNVRDPQLLCRLYNAADFLIFPTLSEGFPLVPMEAMACGLPIIISKECPTKEIIRDGIEGFVVDQRKPECYTEKIAALFTDHYKTLNIPLRCRKLAEKYSWENVGQEYLRVYTRLVR